MPLPLDAYARRVDDAVNAIAGPDAANLRTTVDVRGEDMTTVADFAVGEGDRVPFVLTWFASHRPAPASVDAVAAVADTQSWWEDWTESFAYDGDWANAVLRSTVTLKALTYQPTGGIV